MHLPLVGRSVGSIPVFDFLRFFVASADNFSVFRWSTDINSRYENKTVSFVVRFVYKMVCHCRRLSKTERCSSRFLSGIVFAFLVRPNVYSFTYSCFLSGCWNRCRLHYVSSLFSHFIYLFDAHFRCRIAIRMQ